MRLRYVNWGSKERQHRASLPSTQGDENDLSYLEHRNIRMAAPVNRIGAQYNGHRTVNYMKGKHKFEELRFESYHDYEKEQQGDFRFWMWFHANWYETVIMTKTHPTTEMKSMDWGQLNELMSRWLLRQWTHVKTCTCMTSCPSTVTGMRR